MTVSPATSSAMPPIGPATSGSTSGGSAATSALDFTSNFNTFLTLLTTQLQNQDPLSPMDSNTFTQQLVEFSQVEQQINTNTNLQSLISLQTAAETIQSLPLVGDTIEYNSPTAPLQNGSADYTYTLPTNASTVALAVTDATGNVVFATTGATSAGQSNFVWNGQNGAGQTMPAGAYTLDVVAYDANKQPITASVQSYGTVSSVGVSKGQASFSVGGVTVPMSELVTVNPAKNPATASN
jgi:flagellar basal-body rod modification protein FlgD